MRGYVLDTSAVSLLAPARERDRGSFQEWVREHADSLFLSVISVAEIQAGISQLKRKAAHRRGTDLELWLNGLIELYESRILSLTVAVGRETGRLLDRAIGNGVDAGFEDAAIAATASVHDLTVITANVRHFKVFGVRFIPPPI